MCESQMDTNEVNNENGDKGEKQAGDMKEKTMNFDLILRHS